MSFFIPLLLITWLEGLQSQLLQLCNQHHPNCKKGKKMPGGLAYLRKYKSNIAIELTNSMGIT